MRARILILLLAACLFLSVPKLGARSAPRRVAVVDLRAYVTAADFPNLARSGVTGVVVPIPRILQGEKPAASLGPALQAFNNMRAFEPRFRANGCRTSAGETGTWLGAEAPDELSQAPTAIGLWVTRGVRIFRLVEERDSALATSANARPPGAVRGLTPVGRTVVENVFAAGGLVDVSGLSELSIDDVIEIAEASHAPVVATHSNASAIADQPWNLSDTELRRIAKTGGVIGVSFERHLLVRGRPAELRDVVRQIIHMVDVAGIDHVALGSGFGTGKVLTHDLELPSDFSRLATALSGAGLSDAAVDKIFHENALRVLCSSPAPR
ncbi:MAG TPA: membrane dipeptidase [Polyangiaceae bacterium]|jgi:membrane dipeptidase